MHYSASLLSEILFWVSFAHLMLFSTNIKFLNTKILEKNLRFKSPQLSAKNGVDSDRSK